MSIKVLTKIQLQGFVLFHELFFSSRSQEPCKVLGSGISPVSAENSRQVPALRLVFSSASGQVKVCLL